MIGKGETLACDTGEMHSGEFSCPVDQYFPFRRNQETVIIEIGEEFEAGEVEFDAHVTFSVIDTWRNQKESTAACPVFFQENGVYLVFQNGGVEQIGSKVFADPLGIQGVDTNPGLIEKERRHG